MAQGKSVRELWTGVPGMSVAEFTFWRAYDRIDPFGQDRADWRAAQTTAAILNVHRSGNQDPAKVAEFIFDFEPKESVPVMTPQQLSENIDAIFGQLLAQQGS